MNIFKKAEDELKAEIELLSEESEKQTARVAELESAAKEQAETIVSLQSELETSEAKAAELSGKLEASESKAAELEETLAGEPERATKAVAAKLAEMGIDQVALEPDSGSHSDGGEDIAAKFNSLSGAQKEKFYQEHRSEILSRIKV